MLTSTPLLARQNSQRKRTIVHIQATIRTSQPRPVRLSTRPSRHLKPGAVPRMDTEPGNYASSSAPGLSGKDSKLPQHTPVRLRIFPGRSQVGLEALSPSRYSYRYCFEPAACTAHGLDGQDLQRRKPVEAGRVGTPPSTPGTTLPCWPRIRHVSLSSAPRTQHSIISF